MSKHNMVVDLRLLKSNTYQPRRYGAIPNLNKQGYGLFSQNPDDPHNANLNKKKLKNKDGTDKLPLYAMLTGKPELWPVAVGLIDKYEPEIRELADAIAGSMQLHNIGILPLDPKDHSKGYDIVYGCRRSIAQAYNYARSNGKLPLTIKADICVGGGAGRQTGGWDDERSDRPAGGRYAGGGRGNEKPDA